MSKPMKASVCASCSPRANCSWRQVRQLERNHAWFVQGLWPTHGQYRQTPVRDRARELAQDQGLLAEVVRPMLAARKAMLEQLTRLDRMVLRAARRDPVCRRLMTASGVGTIVALAFRTTSTCRSGFVSR